VVRIRRSKGEVVQDCDVYIGRRLTMGGWRLAASEWAMKDCGTRKEACRKYEAWLLAERPDLVARSSAARRWCAPAACHGDVLARLADA
jgi:hypothetical protein